MLFPVFQLMPAAYCFLVSGGLKGDLINVVGRTDMGEVKKMEPDSSH